ncbi:poly-gamma-glutamate biosynthesis protein PgsC/CapC [Streptomyces sp. LX-29]|uniref:poly-gamma-glutamate biosynthesis protein PgsC/CapC n=1 Tax=unclassified Streptomyces TaxID=2593676 RepID=UPI0011854F2F|nr:MULTISPECIES: poly-gamma-glutamate biosynthesis protein PgsC/CapC [unclassified Streptomyces]TVL90421.1 capsule biosynthesis protein capC [Streptomyces sp. SAJ15]WFB10497.1 poly-gamma-glutamate biosynthesis protein PgsC/CapC [Streptomyces sp. LX-29]
MIPVVITPQIAALGIALGLVFSLVCYLTTNLSPGGMVTPGWLALTLVTDVVQAALMIGVMALTFLTTKVLQRHVILYGKRLFAAVVLSAVLLQTTVILALQREFPLLHTAQTLGFIVPGLIAYQLVRQPVAPTVISTTAVTLGTYVVLVAGLLMGALPVG